MHTFWRFGWEIFFPPTKDEQRIIAATKQDILDLYQPRRQHGHFTCTSYQQPLVRSLITTNKFSANRQAAQWLSLLLNTFLDTVKEPVTLVPVPLSTKRERKRGHNQTTTILQQLPEPHIQELLCRTRDTPPQTSCDRKTRHTNVADAFEATSLHSKTPLGTIFIVDDVVTTGSTLRAAKQALAQAYPAQKIHTIALARST